MISNTTARRQRHAPATQDWTPGATVRVGFLTLTVLRRVPTPGDYRPDLYEMTDPARPERLYRFTPHLGLERVQ